MVLETSEERVKLLRAGLIGRQIELLWVSQNGYRIVDNILYTQFV